MKAFASQTERVKSEYTLVWGSVSLALIMDVLPLPQWSLDYWPQWTLLTVIYWGLALPHRFNIKFAWFTGLLVDIISGTWLGQNALLYTLAIYLTILFHKRLRFYIPQQLVFVAILLAAYILITLWVESIYNTPDRIGPRFFAVISGLFAWLWVYAVLRHLRRKFYALFGSARIRT